MFFRSKWIKRRHDPRAFATARGGVMRNCQWYAVGWPYANAPLLPVTLVIGLLGTSMTVGCGSRSDSSVALQGKIEKLQGRPLAGQKYTNPKDESVLVYIPGGEFVMGSEKGDEDERPAHKVKIKGLWLGIYEVTNKQFRRYIEETGEYQPVFWGEEGFSDPDQPIVGITWLQAAGYCEWAGLRLPTEAEWEYAAAGGKQMEYPTATGEISHDLANYRGMGERDKWEEGPSPVGSFPPNPFGLFDMAGNAWEFTSSIYEPYPYVGSGSRENLKKKRRMQVLRGGSWGFSASYCRTARRHRFESHLTYDYAGLRVASDDEPIKWDKVATAPVSKTDQPTSPPH